MYFISLFTNTCIWMAILHLLRIFLSVVIEIQKYSMLYFFHIQVSHNLKQNSMANVFSEPYLKDIMQSELSTVDKSPYCYLRIGHFLIL